MSLSKRLRETSKQPPPKPVAVWKGPEEDGVTFSMISRWLVCRERFRLLVVEGLRPAPQFNHRVEYGHLWHTCEEALAAVTADPRKAEVNTAEEWGKHVWETPLKAHAMRLARQYPMQAEQVDHWYQVCKAQFPLYVDYWSKHPDVLQRTPLLQEQVFDVPHTLPSGRTVRLRGKWDSVDLIGEGKGAGVYLQENKTKGDINPEQLKRQLAYDLQTMTYLTALHEKPSCDLPRTAHYRHSNGKEYPILGVRYNVCRRPLSGGKGSIVRHKPTKSNPAGESKEDFYARVAQYIKDEPEHFFMRWKVEVSQADLQKFQRECLNPLLEQLCRWWDYILAHDAVTDSYSDVWSHNTDGIHFRAPYGAYNPLLEGASTDLDQYLDTGNSIGLVRVNKLFEELEE